MNIDEHEWMNIESIKSNHVDLDIAHFTSNVTEGYNIAPNKPTPCSPSLIPSPPLSLRYRAIVRPMELHTSGTPQGIVLRAAAIWLFSMTLAVPEAVFSDLHAFHVNHTDERFVTCAPYPNTGKLHPKIHAMVSFLLFYVLPLLVITVYYVFIARSLMLSAHNMPVEGNVHVRRQVRWRDCVV